MIFMAMDLTITDLIMEIKLSLHKTLIEMEAEHTEQEKLEETRQITMTGL